MAGSTNLQFAVVTHVLAYLAGNGVDRPVSSDELAESTNTSPVYVRRALGPLRESGLVVSTPGAHGGWRLNRAPDDIALDEVWRLVHGDAPVLGLHGADPHCPVGRTITAALRGLDRDVAGAITAELRRTTLSDLVSDAVTDNSIG